MENLGRRDGVVLDEVRKIAREDGPIIAVFRDSPMAAFDQAGVEGNDVHEIAHPGFFHEKTPPHGELGMLQGGIEEKLHGIITGLPVDVYTPCEIRGDGIVQPVIIGEPAIPVREADEFSAAGMIQPNGRLPDAVYNTFHTGHGGENLPHLGKNRQIIHINMGHLVICQSKGPAGTTVQQFPAQLLTDGEPTVLAQHPVEMHGLIHRRDPIF